jgi:hypothetical protein
MVRDHEDMTGVDSAPRSSLAGQSFVGRGHHGGGRHGGGRRGGGRRIRGGGGIIVPGTVYLDDACYIDDDDLPPRHI